MLAIASGHLGIDVFLLSDSSMGADEFQVYSVDGLTHSTNGNTPGWLCFCQTRCGNPNFFHWYITTVVASFVHSSRSILINADYPLNDDSSRFYMVADGEEVQLAPLENDAVAKILEDYKIDFGKGPASCTNTVGNACDRSNLFKSTKKVLSSMNTVAAVDYSDPVVESAIYKIISTNRTNFTAANATFLSRGVVKICKSLSKVVNFQIVMHGFHRIGVYPLSARRCISNCDIETLNEYDAGQLDAIIDSVPSFVEEFVNEETGGQVLESSMDAGIPNIPNDDRRIAPKDARTQSQQRAVMVSNTAARKRRKHWILQHRKDKEKTAETHVLEDPSSSTSSSRKRKRAPNTVYSSN